MHDSQEDYDLADAKWDVHTLTGTFKLFFRELHSPLLPDEFYAEMKELVISQNLRGQSKKGVNGAFSNGVRVNVRSYY